MSASYYQDGKLFRWIHTKCHVISKEELFSVTTVKMSWFCFWKLSWKLVWNRPHDSVLSNSWTDRFPFNWIHTKCDVISKEKLSSVTTIKMPWFCFWKLSWKLVQNRPHYSVLPNSWTARFPFNLGVKPRRGRKKTNSIHWHSLLDITIEQEPKCQSGRTRQIQ